MTASEILIGLLIAAAFAGAVYLVQRHEKQRRLQLQALAREHGWAFEPGRDWDLPARFAHFPLFTRGKDRYGLNTMSGQLRCGALSCATVTGDYHYTETNHLKGEDSDTTYQVSYLALITPFEAMPALTVRPEGMMDRLGQALGFDDIDFESEEFSRRFCVKGPDKRFAYDLLHPRMMTWLLDTPPPPFVMAAGQLCVASTGSRWSHVEYRHVISWTRDFVALWPEHLLRSLEERRSAT